MIRYFAFDTETTGLDDTIDEVISLAYALLDENLELVEKGQWFALPTSDALVSEEAARVNGYSRGAWEAKGAGTQDELFTALTGLWERFQLNRAFPLGQNVGFDLRFLNARARKDPAFERAYRAAVGYHAIDTVTLAVCVDQAHGLAGPSNRYRLTDLAERWGVPLTNAHDALADIEATVGVYRAYLELLKSTVAPPRPLPGRVLEKTADGAYAILIGKYKGQPVERLDLGYLRWAVNNMTLRTEEKQIFEAAYRRRMGG